MAYSDEVLADSPVGYWRLDDTSGTVAEDATANNRDGTYVNAPTLAAASLLPVGGGTAVHLNGTSQRVSIAHHSDFNDSASGFTFEAWVKLDNPDANALQIIADKTNLSTANNQWVIYWDNRSGVNTHTLVFRWASAGNGIWNSWVGTVARDALAAGGHLVFTLAPSSQVTLYWNGAEVSSTTSVSAAGGATTQPLMLGARSDGTGFFLDGVLDEVAIYRSVLSAARVQAHYDAGVGAGGPVPAPELTLTLDVVDPAIPAAAPTLELTLEALDPEVTYPTVEAPTLTVDLDVPGPALPVVAPVVTLTVDVADPSVPGVVVDAPVLTLGLSVPAPVFAVEPFSLSFESGAALTLAELLDYEALSLAFASGAGLSVLVRRTHTIDPVTGLPQYRLRVVTPDGTGVAELPKAQIGDLIDELNDEGGLSFTLPMRDATTPLVTPRDGEPVPEVQLWRGPNLEGWVKVDGKRDRDNERAFSCTGLIGYLDDRVVGKVPKRNLLLNGDFEDGLQHWPGSYLEGSIPAAPPKTRVVDVDFFGQPRKAMEITGQDEVVTSVKAVETAAVFVPNEATFLPGGADLITAAAEDIPAGIESILIEGHTAYAYIDGDYGDGLALSLARANAAKPLVQAVHPDATITTEGKGRFEPVASNSTHEGQAKNRRVELHYSGTITAEGHRQYRGQTVQVVNDTGRPMELTFDGYFRLTDFIEESLDGFGVWIGLEKASEPGVVLEEANSTIDADTPRDEWVFAEASLTVPNNTTPYVVRVRYFPPDGTIQWTAGGLYPDDALFYPDTDQALIVKGLVEHAQDPAMGKLGDAPILLGTRTPTTGVKRKRTYYFHEREVIGTKVGEFTGLHNGVDVSVELSETQRWVTTHYPRRGQAVPVTLALGSNVVDYDAPASVADSATRVIFQGLEGSGANRREGFATDLTGLGGTLLERVAYAKAETPPTELEEGAVSAVARYGHPVTDLVVTVGLTSGSLAARVALTSDLLDRVKVGDTVEVEILDGDTAITGPHRVVRRILTPETDTLRYALTPEV